MMTQNAIVRMMAQGMLVKEYVKILVEVECAVFGQASMIVDSRNMNSQTSCV